MGYNSWGHKESDMTEHTCTAIVTTVVDGINLLLNKWVKDVVVNSEVILKVCHERKKALKLKSLSNFSKRWSI